MVFATKAAAFYCDFSYGKPGMVAILNKPPIKIQNNLAEQQNLAALLPSLESEQCCQLR